MNKFLNIFALNVLFIFAMACGGSSRTTQSRFSSPRFIASTSTGISMIGNSTKLAYVSNYTGGYLSIIDTEKRRTVDTDLFDGEITPLAVAPMLGYVLLRSSEEANSSFDVFVASSKNNLIYLFRTDLNGSATENFVGHTAVDLGTTEFCEASLAYFEDKGNLSNPSIANISTLVGTTKTENWLVEYSSSLQIYTVTGSQSGLQVLTATEDTPYVSDAGEVSFTIYAGSRETTKKDNFTFGTTCSKPLELTGKPSTFLFSNDKLFVAIEDSNKISLYNESDFSFDQDVVLSDLSATQFMPSSIVEFDGKLWVSNSLGDSIARIDPVSLVVDYYDIGEPQSYISFSNSVAQTIYLLLSTNPKLKIFSTSTLLADGRNSAG